MLNCNYFASNGITTRANVILNCNLDINHSLSMKSSMSLEENDERELYCLMGYKTYGFK